MRGVHVTDVKLEVLVVPEGCCYGPYASLNDPDGNRGRLQEVTERLPGRV
jgi:hypothetical protein